MIPEYRLSTTAAPDDFLGARNNPLIGPILDYEDGGIGIQDPSAGLLVQVWTGRVSQNAVLLSAPNTPEFTWLTGESISEFSFTFDQNMKPTVSYIDAGIAKLNWFDLVDNVQKTTTFGAEYRHPRVALDDKHPLASGTSDVIFAYVRSGSLYFRAQRDRYAIEYFLKADVIETLRKIGMNTRGRFQFGFNNS